LPLFSPIVTEEGNFAKNRCFFLLKRECISYSIATFTTFPSVFDLHPDSTSPEFSFVAKIIFCKKNVDV
jgi:hypothetical protein